MPSLIARHTSYLEPLEARIAPATIYAIDTNNNLISFDSATPTVIDTTVAITGLQANESIHGMDFRPANGQLYVLGVLDPGAADNTGQIYTLDLTSGAVTAIGTAFSTTLADASSYGFDFNPLADRIRITTSNDVSLRVNPDTGALSATDTNLADATLAESIVGAAYDQNFAGTPTTTLYAINFAVDDLALIGGINGSPSPNLGAVASVGDLGFVASTSANVGFDIQTTSAGSLGYYSANIGGNYGLYTVNLATGAATSVGNIGTGATAIRDIAVAIISDLNVINTKTATYTDIDGDIVTVKTSAAVLDTTDFSFIAGPNGGQQLVSLNLSDDAAVAGSSITFSVKRGVNGDGLAHVGHINANGHNLGKVTVKGDLGRITADFEQAGKPALAGLYVHSMGTQGILSQGGNGNLTSSIDNGLLSAISVKTNIQGAEISVTGAQGKIGNVTIGGSLIGGSNSNSGSIISSGNIGLVKIGGDLVGGTSNGTGNIYSTSGKIQGVTIAGSLIGGSGGASGLIYGNGIGAITVGKDVIGGSADYDGTVWSNAELGKISIKGSLIGGGGDFSGFLFSVPGGTEAFGAVTIGGSIIGSSGAYSGSLYSTTNGNFASLTVGHSIIGGSASFSGALNFSGNVGAVKIGGNLIGGSASASGGIYTVAGNIASVTVGGSVIGGDGHRTGILSGGTIGTVSIKGDLRDGLGADGVFITAKGFNGTIDAKTVVAIKSVTVGGSVINADILAGYTTAGAASQYGAQIGSVTVGRDLIASDIAAGIDSVNGIFGDSNDIITMAGTGSFYSKIASITVKGQVQGSATSGDRFAFTAVSLGSVKVGGFPLALSPSNFADSIFISPTGDVRVREIELL